MPSLLFPSHLRPDRVGVFLPGRTRLLSLTLTTVVGRMPTREYTPPLLLVNPSTITQPLTSILFWPENSERPPHPSGGRVCVLQRHIKTPLGTESGSGRVWGSWRGGGGFLGISPPTALMQESSAKYLLRIMPHRPSHHCSYPGEGDSMTGSSSIAPSVTVMYHELTQPSAPLGAMTRTQIPSGACARISRRSPSIRTCSI